MISSSEFDILQNSLTTMTGLGAERPEFDSRQGQGRDFLFPTTSKPALRPTEPPIQLSLEHISSGQSGRDVKLPTHLHLMPKLRMRGAIPPLSH